MKKSVEYNTLMYMSIIILLIISIVLIYYYVTEEKGVTPPLISEGDASGQGQVAIIIEPNAANSAEQPSDAVMEENT
jgi:flagellar basal body-associated protein FliL